MNAFSGFTRERLGVERQRKTKKVALGLAKVRGVGGEATEGA